MLGLTGGDFNNLPDGGGGLWMAFLFVSFSFAMGFVFGFVFALLLN